MHISYTYVAIGKVLQPGLHTLRTTNQPHTTHQYAVCWYLRIYDYTSTPGVCIMEHVHCLSLQCEMLNVNTEF